MELVLQQGCVVNPATGTVRTEEGVTNLTALEVRLLRRLVAEKTPVPRHELYRDVWGHTRPLDTRAQDFTLKRLRTKLGAGAHNLVTHRGHGVSLRQASVDKPIAGNLQAPPSKLVGRSKECDALDRALQTGGLVTLHGPGGSGKTKLATHMAWQLRSGLNEVWWIDLVGAVTPRDVCHSIARSLGVRLQDADGTDALTQSLSGRGPLLLVLDNFEQCDQDCTWLVDTLATQLPDARFLVTSRRLLELPTEKVVRVGCMTPKDALALYRMRCQEQEAPVPSEAGAIAALLDFLPLPIELAAARARVLDGTVLLEGLEQRLSLLQDKSADRPNRQQTLEAIVKWSWDLLSEEHQQALADLSVFRGSFDIDAAEAVLGTGNAIHLVLDLVSHSLAVMEVEGEQVCFRVLDSIRYFTRNQGMHDCATLRHADHYARYGYRDRLLVMRTAAGHRRLRREAPNVLLALGTAIDHNLDSRIALGRAALACWGVERRVADLCVEVLESTNPSNEWGGLALTLAQALRRLGDWDGAQGWLSRVTETGGEAHLLARVEWAIFAQFEGDTSTAVAMNKAVADEASSRGLTHVEACALNSLACALFDGGDMARAFDAAAQGLVLVGDRDVQLKVRLLNNICSPCRFLDIEQAVRYAEQGLDLAQQLEIPADVCNGAINLATSYIYSGEWADSLTLFNTAIDEARRLGLPYYQAAAQLGAATVHRLLGNLSAGRTTAEAGLGIAECSNYLRTELAIRTTLAEILMLEQEFNEAKLQLSKVEPHLGQQGLDQIPAHVQFMRAILRWRDGECDEAFEMAKAAYELAIPDIRMGICLGVFEEATGLPPSGVLGRLETLLAGQVLRVGGRTHQYMHDEWESLSMALNVESEVVANCLLFSVSLPHPITTS